MLLLPEPAFGICRRRQNKFCTNRGRDSPPVTEHSDESHISREPAVPAVSQMCVRNRSPAKPAAQRTNHRDRSVRAAAGIRLVGRHDCRVGAREVRRRLAQYYATPEGGASEVRIDLPSGSYVPEFRAPLPREWRSFRYQYPSWRAPSRRPAPRDDRRCGRGGGIGCRWHLCAFGKQSEYCGFSTLFGNRSSAIPLRCWWRWHPIVYHPSGRALR